MEALFLNRQRAHSVIDLSKQISGVIQKAEASQYLDIKQFQPQYLPHIHLISHMSVYHGLRSKHGILDVNYGHKRLACVIGMSRR